MSYAVPFRLHRVVAVYPLVGLTFNNWMWHDGNAASRRKFRAGIDFYLTNYLKLNISGQILGDELTRVAVSSSRYRIRVLTQGEIIINLASSISFATHAARDAFVHNLIGK